MCQLLKAKQLITTYLRCLRDGHFRCVVFSFLRIGLCIGGLGHGMSSVDSLGHRRSSVDGLGRCRHGIDRRVTLRGLRHDTQRLEAAGLEDLAVVIKEVTLSLDDGRETFGDHRKRHTARTRLKHKVQFQSKQ